MTTITDITKTAEDLPARVIRTLGMDTLPVERQQRMSRDILNLLDTRLQNEIWAGVAAHDDALDALHAAYADNPDLDPLDALQIAIESQPDMADRFEATIDDLYSSLTHVS